MLLLIGGNGGIWQLFLGKERVRAVNNTLQRT